MMNTDESSQRPKIALIHAIPQWHGGAETVALWTIEALKEHHDLTVFTLEIPNDLEALNQHFGTQIRPGDVRWKRIPIPGFARRCLPFSHLLFRYLIMSYCRHLKHRFDLFVSTYYEMDFGCVGIQYCHSPMYAWRWSTSLRDAGETEAMRRRVKRFADRFLRALTGFRLKRVLNNVTLANSDWTRRYLEAAYDGPVPTLYPPVPGPFPTVSWEDRANGFVCAGRLTPDKRVDAVIRILGRVRDHGPDIHLHIVATSPDQEYQNRIEKLASGLEWVTIHWDLPRSRLTGLIAENRFGIHARVDEHFGIAVAESMMSGNIVFNHNSGGQVEITGDPRLHFVTEDEAVEKILHVLTRTDEQDLLRRQLRHRREWFSTSHFCGQMQHYVRQLLDPATYPEGARTLSHS